MDKAKNIERFQKSFLQLTETERKEFSRLCNKLQAVSFLCGKKEDDRSDYYLVISRLSMYQDYFSVMDNEVVHYAHDQVIHLYNPDKSNHYLFRMNESIILLLLRKLYVQKMKTVSLSENVTVTAEELHDSIAQTGWLGRRMNKTEFRNVIRLLKRFNIVDNIGDIEKDSCILIIYPTIAYAVSYEDITAIDARIRSYKGDEQNEETEEDPAD